MARWILADGHEHQITPKGERWELKELQQAVGGYIEVVPRFDFENVMICNENGHDLPLNETATRIWHEAIAAHFGVAVELLPALVGHQLRYWPELRGNILLLKQGDLW